jgi:DNA-binding LacI/PurR family transcriptional regulator
MQSRTSKSSIQDVARCAGVSTATVSMVVNSKGKFTDRTRRRVLNACKKLSYRAHPMARLLPRMNGRESRFMTGYLGFTVVMEPDSEAFYVEFLKGIANAGFPESKRIVYEQLKLGQPLSPSLFSGLGVDGRFLVGLVDDAVLDIYASENVPMVVMGDHRCRKPVWNINLDCQEGGRVAARHLWEFGHRRFLLFCEDYDVDFQRQFRQGFLEELEKFHVRKDDCVVLEGFREGRIQLREMLTHAETRPTAIAAIEARTTTVAIECCRQAGLTAPRDFSIIALGRNPGASVDVMVTSIDPCWETIGYQAMDLMSRLTGKEHNGDSGRILIPPRLVKCESTGIAPA